MKSILEDIFYGNLDPSGEIISQDPERTRQWKQAERERNYLKSRLSPADDAHVSNLENSISSAFCLDICAAYAYGLRQGAQLYRELMEPD